MNKILTIISFLVFFYFLSCNTNNKVDSECPDKNFTINIDLALLANKKIITKEFIVGKELRYNGKAIKISQLKVVTRKLFDRYFNTNTESVFLNLFLSHDVEYDKHLYDSVNDEMKLILKEYRNKMALKLIGKELCSLNETEYRTLILERSILYTDQNKIIDQSKEAENSIEN